MPAQKVTDRGIIEITATLLKQQKSKAVIEIVVQDMGPGVPEDKQEFLHSAPQLALAQKYLVKLLQADIEILQQEPWSLARERIISEYKGRISSSQDRISQLQRSSQSSEGGSALLWQANCYNRNNPNERRLVLWDGSKKRRQKEEQAIQPCLML